MLSKLLTSLVDNKNSLLYSLFGLSLLSGYYLLGRHHLANHYDVQLQKKQNLLDSTVQQLLNANVQPNIMKIVFTEADKSTGNFRKIVIDKIKQLFPEKGIGVLINCSPKKLLQAGSESFADTFQHQDEQYSDYIINFLKTELIVEDTIQKLQAVTQLQKPNEQRFAIMLCDNNCLDMKRIVTQKGVYLNERIHQLALNKLNIKIRDLYDLYSFVVHFQEDPEFETKQEIEQNQKIERLWGNIHFRGFYQKFKYDSKKSKQDNVNYVVNQILQQIIEWQKKQLKTIKKQNLIQV